jgi:signal transduction histidine kinase
MARDLHDTLAQGLTAILLQLEVASKPDASLGEVSTHVGVALNLVRSSMMEVRSFIRNLRTQTQQDVALASALADVLRTAVDGGDLRAPFRIEGKERKLATNVEAQIIRVTQEAVLNAIQHSGATEISLVLEYAEKDLTVCVSDNGHGFEQTAASQKRLHFGLVGMRERAGLIGAELSIETSPGKGTRVALSVPYHAVLLDKVL